MWPLKLRPDRVRANQGGARPRSYGKSGRRVQPFGFLACLTILCSLFGAAPQSRAEERPIRIVALGDSLTAGLGLGPADTFPVKLGRALAAKGVVVDIANAGVSGDTASAGLARLDWSVPEGTDAVILELGANDALRGLDPALTRQALDAILTRLKQRRIAVLLCGIRAPRNLGADYARAFDAIFPDLAARHGAAFYPFFLDGVVGDPRLNQRDGIHPTAAGVDVIVARILPSVETLVGRLRAARGS
jgi:acyl-CoA thioesterase-1